MKRTDEERAKLCLGLYEGEKSRNFMLHLVRSYSQLIKVNAVTAFNEKQKHKCAICDVKLFSVNDSMELVDPVLMPAEEIEKFKSNLNILTIGNHELSKNKAGTALAYSGEETDTCLCSDCANAVNRFTLVKIIEGDAVINRTVKNMREKQMGIEREQRITHRNVKASTTLGSLPGFDKLIEVFKK